MGTTPFTDKILRAKLPKGFDKPTNMKYHGTKDPQEHLTAVEARMNLEGATDAVQYRAFPFTTRITKAKHPISLLRVTQRQDKSTRKYLDRFNDECLMVEGLTDSITSLCLSNGLMNKDFRRHLTTKPLWTMHEIQSVAREYINDVEVSQVVTTNKRQHDNTAPRHHLPPRKTQKEHPKPANTNRPPRVRKFSNYTPLLAPITEIYHQIAERCILLKTRQLKERTGGNKSLYCDYHRVYGNRTQDYFDLNDVLEQAI
ncbi:uncharacterized protein [Arachis hypogaea]|uniref:uncharacterized protein n=1 Tax=Arachis hypogaea TaxID=3818 RepID=UPI003B21806E